MFVRVVTFDKLGKEFSSRIFSQHSSNFRPAEIAVNRGGHALFISCRLFQKRQNMNGLLAIIMLFLLSLILPARLPSFSFYCSLEYEKWRVECLHPAHCLAVKLRVRGGGFLPLNPLPPQFSLSSVFHKPLLLFCYCLGFFCDNASQFGAKAWKSVSAHGPPLAVVYYTSKVIEQSRFLVVSFNTVAGCC